MYVHVRRPRTSLAALAVFSLIVFGPAWARADDDAPAPETNDQSKSTATNRKNGEAAREQDDEEAEDDGTSASQGNDGPKTKGKKKKEKRKEDEEKDAKDVKVDSTGAFSEKIRLEIPSFQKLAPKLSLDYASASPNGWVGVGWNLGGVSRIERASPGKGAPRYDASDIYLLDGEELVPCVAGSASPSCTTGGTHSTKTESYLKIALAGAGTAATWTITEKDGTKSVYAPVFSVPGADGQSGTTDDAVFRWGIRQVTDAKGNTVTYNWAVNQFGGLWDYLDSITYNGTTIKIHYEQRADVETGAIGGGLGEIVSGRIKTIDVSVGGSRLRSYQLSYGTSGATGRSLLTSVRQFGKDATLDASGTVTGGTSLPAFTAGYPAVTSPSFVAQNSDAAMGAGADRRFIALDINGDGKSDMLEVYKSCFILCSYAAAAWTSNGTGGFSRTGEVAVPAFDEPSQFIAMDINGDGKDDFIALTKNGDKWKRTIFLSNGSGFTVGANDSSMVYKVDTVDDVKLVRSQFLPADINGDGKTDLIEIYPKTECFFLLCSTNNYGRAAWISTGSGFTQASNEVGGIPYDKDSKFYSLDFNGDGKPDFVEIKPGLFGASERRVWLGNGTKFTLGRQDASTYDKNMRVLPIDVNGDGKQDLVEIVPDFLGTRRKTWLSTGSSFTLASSTFSGLGLTATSARVIAGDFNGDGKTDFATFTGALLSVQRTIFLSTGGDFVVGTVDYLGSGSSHKYIAGDFNGDGRSDMVELWAVFGTTGRRAWLTGGAHPDLLTSFTGAQGGTTTVSYTPSSAWANVGSPPIVQTATAVSVGDGRGGTSTTTFTYAGGKYDVAQQRFLGFASQRQTEPCITGESACPYKEVTFRQDFGAMGKMSRIDDRDGSGKLLRSQVFDYLTNNGTLPWTAVESGRWEYVYVNTGAACPGADCKRKYTGRTYNAYGEVIQAVNYGDYDVSGDEDTTTTTFVPNTAAYIVNLPADVKTFQGVGTSGSLLDETLSYYDGATSWNAAPAAGYVTKTARWLSSPSSFIETKKEYDAWGNVTATVNALGARTTTTYDPTYHRFATSVTNPLGHVTTASFDPACGTATQRTDVNGQATTFTFDALCRLAQETAPGGKFERHVWANLGDASSQYEQIEGPPADGTTEPFWTRRYFDGQNRTWREVEKGPNAATGNIYVDTTYNARGEQASKTEPYYWASGQATTYTNTFGYDALDRPTRVTTADGARATISYGLWSRTVTDELGRSKTDRQNARGKRIAHDEIVGGATKTTTYVYDARQYVRQSIDTAGNTTTYTYDSLGRRTSIADPDFGTTTYEYDGAGRRTAQTDAKGQRTTFGYDALDRKTSKTSRAGTAQALTVAWNYDEARAGYHNRGKLTSKTDSAGGETIDYDVAGHAVYTVRTTGGASYAFQRGFDAGDRPLWTTYPDGDTLGTPAAPIRYDGAGRLLSIPGYVTSIAYDPRGKVIQVNNANGTVTSTPRSAARGWIDSITTMAGSIKVQELVYTRNAKGMVSQIQSPFANEGWTYTYDELDRLTSATNASNAAFNQTLTYDAIGNITSNSRVGTYTYGPRPHAVTSAGGNAYTYDAAGLMVSGPGKTMAWDGDSRLVSMTNGGTTTTFAYDADGARIQKVEGTSSRRYVGDDYEVDELGAVTKYVSIGETLVARKDATTKTWIHTDQLGSIQAETAPSGSEVFRQKYRPYGEILSTNGEIDDEARGFSGQRHDGTGLLYLHARYYDPILGRFISPDSIVDGPDTIGLNRYAYTHNDPINGTDPTGHSLWRVVATVTAGVVGGLVGGPVGAAVAAAAVSTAFELTDDQPGVDVGRIAFDTVTAPLPGAGAGLFRAASGAVAQLGKPAQAFLAVHTGAVTASANVATTEIAGATPYALAADAVGIPRSDLRLGDQPTRPNTNPRPPPPAGRAGANPANNNRRR